MAALYLWKVSDKNVSVHGGLLRLLQCLFNNKYLKVNVRAMLSAGN